MFRGFVITEISLFKMLSSECNSDLRCISDDDSEYNYIPGIYLDFEKEKGETIGSDWGVDDLSGDHAKSLELNKNGWKNVNSSKLKKNWKRSD